MMSFLFGDAVREDATKSGLKGLFARVPLSKYLPWEAYDERTGLYYMVDGTFGFLWECSPLIFAGNKSADTLGGLFGAGLPTDTVLQFILHADDHVDPIIDEYKRLKAGADPVSKSAVSGFADFLKKGARGMQSLAGVPIRNFRLFVCIRFPKDRKKMYGVSIPELRTAAAEILRGAFLDPRPLEPGPFLDWLRRLFNDQASLNNLHYDRTTALRKQVILGTPVSRENGCLHVGEKVFRCLTPKLFPEEVDLFQTNQLTGGVWGLISDMDQIKTPFLYSINVLFSDLKSKLRWKCEFVLFQQAAGSLARSLADKKDEYSWAVHEIDRGSRFVQVIPTLWTWGHDQTVVMESAARMKRMWESAGYVMQEDRQLLVPLFVYSLPFGLYDDSTNIQLLERDFITDPASAAKTLPLQGDFAGCGRPVLLFVGRKGQICTLDIFDKKNGDNYNCFIAAGSGGGKSFTTNYFVSNYRAAGSIIRLIDIGGSYKKAARITGGKFLDFTRDSDICLNPFSTVLDINEDLSSISAILLQMIYSATDAPPGENAETIWTLIKDAALWAYDNEGPEAGTDTVYTWLLEFPYHSKGLADRLGRSADRITEKARELAFNMREFTTREKGRFGKWVNGKSTFDISKDEFVVLELENLKPVPELFKVVTLQVINDVVQDLYLSDRSRNRFVILDEAWQFMGAQNIAMATIIEGGFRRARKYGGSFIVITQSVGDLKNFGPVGEVIRTNAAYKFLLAANNYDDMRAQKVIDYDDFTLELLKSVRRNGSKYSEIFVDSPAGKGVVRLVVDPYSYYVNTSDPQEFAEIESLVRDGMNYDEAIRHMVRKYRS